MNEKRDLKQVIQLFIDKWDNTDGMWRNEFFKDNNLVNSHQDFRINISFGNSGNRIKLPKYPYITFLKNEFKTSDGVYPIVFYKHDQKKIEVGLGVSENKEPNMKRQTINAINNYPRKDFDLSNIDEIVNYIDESIEQFNKILSNNIEVKNSHKIKNIILYGPPGVGKTHNIAKLIRLIEEGREDREIFSAIQNNEASNEQISDEIKERTAFITFHQSFGYEDFIEGFRPNEDGKIELVDGVFKQICEVAQTNLDNSQRDRSVNFENLLNDFANFIEEQESIELDNGLVLEVNRGSDGSVKSFVTKGRVKDQSLTRNIIERDFQNFLDGKIGSYRDIKPKYESKSSYHGNAPYYYKLYEKLKAFMADRSEYKVEKERLQNYYLVIDEINRGNISKIFGELITLIEEDKRDRLEVTLPYSKEPFKVPSNLYIIGTMNSTDKSIALIDIALRRRFTFLKMEPNVALVDNPEAKEIFEKLNDYISDKLEDDYQIGHSYFMGNIDLSFVLEYKIKPLLEEYFYGDEDSKNEALKYLEIGYNTDSMNERE